MAEGIAREVADRELRGARSALRLGLLASIVAMIGLPPLLHFRVDYLSFSGIALFAAIPGVFVPYARWRRMAALHSVLELAATALLLTLPILIVTYAAMRLNLPMADARLMALDRALGFDWTAFVRLVDRSPLASKLLLESYTSFSLQILFLPMLLCVFRLQARAYRFLLAFLLLCVAAAAISVPFPSIGAYVAHGLDPDSLRNVNAHFGYFYLESFRAVREQADFVLRAGNAAGIITFPSVHAGVAVLCAWAAWRSRLLRYPFLVLNSLMFVSAISHGAHYLVDVIGGGVVAGAAIWATGRLCAHGWAVRPSSAPLAPAQATV